MTTRTSRETSNAALAGQARELAALAVAGSLDRRAYGCAAVALSTTGTLGAARKALAFVTLADVRDAALLALDGLTGERAA